MARRYNRDRRGRFASVGATARGGRLTTLGGQRYATSTKRIAGPGPAGTIKPGKRRPAAIAASNKISRLSRGASGAPRALRANALRAFNPKSPGLQQGQLIRQIQRTSKDTTGSLRATLQDAGKRLNWIARRADRRTAADIANRNSKDPGKRIVSEVGRRTVSARRGVRVIQERGQRAAAAAARGSKAGRRALDLYDNQLAYTGKGKPKAAKNNLRPGPRNQAGPPKRTRRKRR